MVSGSSRFQGFLVTFLLLVAWGLVANLGAVRQMTDNSIAAAALYSSSSSWILKTTTTSDNKNNLSWQTLTNTAADAVLHDNDPDVKGNEDEQDGGSQDDIEETENDLKNPSPKLRITGQQQQQRPVSNLDETTKVAIRNRLQADPNFKLLPRWTQDYLQWHAEMRKQFPDTRIVTDPAAPKLLVHTCKSKCGGTHDRLGKVEATLAYASLSHRVVLMSWHTPAPLQAFLEPNLCNWTVPNVPQFTLDYLEQHDVRDFKQGWKKKGYIHLWTQKQGIENQTVLVQYKNIPTKKGLPVVDLELNQRSVMGAIFRSMFRPSAAVQAKINHVYQQLNLSPGHYVATHCRVRHPGLYGYDTQGKDEGHDADKSGLSFEGEYKQKAIETALRGIQCAAGFLSSSSHNASTDGRSREPIYFLSDSEELVDYVVHGMDRDNATNLDVAVTKWTQSHSIVARKASGFPTLHIDRQKGYPAEYYMDTFVDLYMAANARCVSFGVGNFGYFASKISATICRNVHTLMATAGEEKRWNQEGKKAPLCPIAKGSRGRGA